MVRLSVVTNCPKRKLNLKRIFAESFRSHPGRWAWLTALAVAGAVFALGAATDLSLGDECYQIKKAEAFYEAGGRLTHDPVYGAAVPPGIPFYDGPLWNGLLALIWNVTGPCVMAAQAFQAFWVFLWIGFAWTAGNELAGPRGGWWSLVVAASVPAILMFGGIVLYVEGALLASVMACSAYALKRKFFLSGLFFGLAFLVKPTIAVAAPAYFVGICLIKEPFWKKNESFWHQWFFHVIVAGLGMALLILPDLVWRQKNLGTIGVVYLSEGGGDAAIPDTVRAMVKEKGPGVYKEISSILNPVDIVMYFGLPLFVGLVLSLSAFKKMDRRVRGMWLVVIVFFLTTFSVMVLRHQNEVRYQLPVLAVLVPLAGLGAAEVFKNRRRLAWGLVLCAVGQAAAVGVVGYRLRRVSPELKSAMDRLDELPVRKSPGFVMAPELYFYIYSGKPILWSALNPSAFFFSWTDDRQWYLLDYYGVDYIVIPKARCYDDSTEKHTAGYPDSWVESLDKKPYVDGPAIIDEGGIMVFRVLPRLPEK